MKRLRNKYIADGSDIGVITYVKIFFGTLSQIPVLINILKISNIEKHHVILIPHEQNRLNSSSL
jgi:hypothetical protein